MIEISDAAGARVELANYSRHKKDLLQVFGRMIGLPEDFPWQVPPVEAVNRSLTASEAYLQLGLMHHLGRVAQRYVSRPLVSKLASVSPDPLRLPDEARNEMLERNRESIDALNALLPEAERLNVDPLPQKERQVRPDDIVFSPAQIDILADAFGTALAKPAALRQARRLKRLLGEMEEASSAGAPPSAEMFAEANRLTDLLLSSSAAEDDAAGEEPRPARALRRKEANAPARRAMGKPAKGPRKGRHAE